MKIKDLNGRTITVTDLGKAFQQAETFKDYHHESEEYAKLDEELRRYWFDMYEKMSHLKEAAIKNTSG